MQAVSAWTGNTTCSRRLTVKSVTGSQRLSGKESTCSAGDTGNAGSIPGLGRSPGGGHGIPLQYSCLENPRDTGAWWAIVHRVTELDMIEETERECMFTHTHRV